jgi:hypothetical protein
MYLTEVIYHLLQTEDPLNVAFRDEEERLDAMDFTFVANEEGNAQVP